MPPNTTGRKVVFGRKPRHDTMPPIERDTITIFAAALNGLYYATTLDEKLRLLGSHHLRKSRFYAVWPGKDRTDVFDIVPLLAIAYLEGE